MHVRYKTGRISEDAVAQRACLFADKVARSLPHVTDSRFALSPFIIASLSTSLYHRTAWLLVILSSSRSLPPAIIFVVGCTSFNPSPHIINVEMLLEKEGACPFHEMTMGRVTPFAYVIHRVRRKPVRDMTLSRRVSLRSIDVGPGRH